MNLNALYLILAVSAGCAVAFQVVINAQLRLYVGAPMQATLCSLVVGAVAALICCLLARYPVPDWDKVARAPWWAWLGGFVGVFYLWCSVVVSPRLGVALTLGLVMTGQMTASLLIDHYGLAGAAVRPVNAGRVIGVILMGVGIGLVAIFRE